MQGEFGLAANSTQPLMIPTELYDQTDSESIAARRAWNDAHAVILDDGADSTTPAPPSRTSPASRG